MLKSYQSIGLLFGAFLFAYAGFLFAGYMERYKPSGEQLTDSGHPAGNGSSATTPLATTPYYKAQNVGDIHAHDAGTATARQSERTSENRKNDNTGKQPGSTQDLTTEQLAERHNATQALDLYQRQKETPPARSTANKRNGLTIATGRSATLATSAGIINDSSAPSPVAGSPDATSTPQTYSPLPVQPVKPAVSADDDTPTGTSQADNTEDDGLVIETADEQEMPLMATPDCPSSLNASISENEIKQMLSAYGCRYRKSCTMKNDGSSDYNCHWEYIRPG